MYQRSQMWKKLLQTILAMTGCWSFMLEYIIMSSWNIPWPLYMGIAQKALDTDQSVDFLYVSKISNVAKSAQNHPGKTLHPLIPLGNAHLETTHFFKKGLPSLFDCQSLNLCVMGRKSQFIRNSQLCHWVTKSLNRSQCLCLCLVRKVTGVYKSSAVLWRLWNQNITMSHNELAWTAKKARGDVQQLLGH